MALNPADNNGVLTGKFRIPKNVRAGTKRVQFIGALGGHAETTFTGQGTVVTNQMRNVHNIMQSYYDPLAQTFMMNDPRQLAGAELFVTAKKATNPAPLIIQLRETSVGFPSNVILAEGRIPGNSVTVDAWNRIEFDTPFYCQPNVEYALVVMSNDAETQVAISELGKFDTNSKQWMTSQPYQIGVLLSSANASTWTSHQDKDLTFRLLARKYTEAERTGSFGTVAFSNVTDILVSAMTTVPATGADANLKLSWGNAGENRTASDGQVIKLNAPLSGDVTIDWTVRANSDADPKKDKVAGALLEPGSQLILGTIAQTADYVSRAIVSKTTTTAGATVRVIYDGIIPPGSQAKIQIGDAKNVISATPEWFDMEQTSAIAGTNGLTEFTWDLKAAPATGNTTGATFLLKDAQNKITAKADSIMIRVQLSGSASARPYVFNLRVAVW